MRKRRLWEAGRSAPAARRREGDRARGRKERERGLEAGLPRPGPAPAAGPFNPRRKGRPGAAPNGLRGASLPGGGRRVARAGRPAGAGRRRRRWQRAGTHAAPRPAWSAALPPPAAAARCPLTSGVCLEKWTWLATVVAEEWPPRDGHMPSSPHRPLLPHTQPAPSFDIYRKVPKDLTQPTYTGAIISVCCCLFILFLFLSELTGFITTEVVNELYVDDPDKDSGGKIDVSLNISLPNLHCELVGLDIQDEMGRHEVGHIDNSMKIPLNNGAGCRFEGQFSINKVPGNFHVSTHSATAQPQNPDMTHVIHKLSFGDTLQVQNVHGAFNALGGADRLSSNPLASHDYILKIVPTVYEDKSGKQRYSYQYTVANKEYVAYSHTGRIIPAIWFRYDLSPITVKYTERRQPLYRFITTICAIIGGTFTVAGILDSCIFTASEAWKKIQLGKMH
ncbi:endoplasmic reticulum-Golgi intermediate compartment protein 1 isoform X1 [Microcebus murinus]|uniref:endoplasmic reticulum-Golgi intermediate compartment protein 1 isoform X1 n=1 Tax=Microcebus murinus TaxID=30608 RepID=UPI003F6C0669